MLQSKPLTIALCFLMWVTPLAQADIIPPGMKSVKSEIVIDFGALKDQCWSTYVVKKDDTLSAISQSLLGVASRWPEIAEANPAIDAVKLKVGSLLEIPPRNKMQQKKGANAEEKTWRIYTWFDRMMSRNKPSLISHGAILRGPRYSGSLIAIPSEQKQALTEALSSSDGDRWQQVAGLARSSDFSSPRMVRFGDPTTSIRTRVTVEFIRDGEIKVSRDVLQLDDAGESISWLSSNRLPLLAISGLGAMLTLLITLRRKKRRSLMSDAEQA